MPSFAISKFTVLLEPLWVSAVFCFCQQVRYCTLSGLVVHNLHLDKCCGESKRLLGEWMDFSFLLLRRRISYSNLLAAEFAEDYNCTRKVWRLPKNVRYSALRFRWMPPRCQKLPVHRTAATADTTNEKSALTGGNLYMKATGIVRRIDDLGRVVIPKEIRRTMRIREGDPLQMTLSRWEKFCFAMLDLSKRWGLDCT